MSKIELKKEARIDSIEDIKAFFLNEKSETLSDFQAANWLDFFIDNIGPHIYNQALADAHKLMNEKVDELYILEKRRFRS